MFKSDSRVRLSDFSFLFSEVVRDCEFFTVGKIPTDTPAKVVPIAATKYLAEMKRRPRDIVGIVCTPEVAAKCPPELGCAVAANPLAAAYKLHRSLAERDGYFWERFESRISPSAKVHPKAYIAPYDVVIGDEVIVHANASIMERSIIGRGTVIGSSTVIGSDAYEMASIDGHPQLIAQVGGVRVGEGVVFLAGVTIARSTFPVMTEIGDYCSFDNQVHVAHDCVLGRGVKMTACSMLSGRVTLGDGVYIGPNATVSNGIVIGANASVSIGAVVASDVEGGARVSGNFAMDHKAFLRAFRTAKTR